MFPCLEKWYCVQHPHKSVSSCTLHHFVIYTERNDSKKPRNSRWQMRQPQGKGEKRRKWSWCSWKEYISLGKRWKNNSGTWGKKVLGSQKFGREKDITVFSFRDTLKHFPWRKMPRSISPKLCYHFKFNRQLGLPTPARKLKHNLITFYFNLMEKSVRNRISQALYLLCIKSVNTFGCLPKPLRLPSLSHLVGQTSLHNWLGGQTR